MKGFEDFRKLGKPWFALLIALTIISFLQIVFLTSAYYFNNDALDDIASKIGAVISILFIIYLIALFIRVRLLVIATKKDTDTAQKS